MRPNSSSKPSPRFYLMAVHGFITLGRPLPLKISALGTQVIPMAEVLPENYESQQQCYSLKAFAIVASISRATVQREIQAKRLKARKLGRRTVIIHEDAMAYLASLRPVESQFPPDDSGATVAIGDEI